MQRHWYGFEHQYGAATCDADGNDIGTVHVFHLKAARDVWVAAGPGDTTAPGHRTTYTAAQVQSWIRRRQDWVIH